MAEDRAYDVDTGCDRDVDQSLTYNDPVLEGKPSMDVLSFEDRRLHAVVNGLTKVVHKSFTINARDP